MLLISFHGRSIELTVMAMALQLCPHQSFSSQTILHTTQRSPPLQTSKHTQKPLKLRSLKEICKDGNLREAFLSFNNLFTFQNPPQVLADEAYSSTLDLCARKEALAQGQQIHSHILTSGFTSDIVFLSTKLVFMYGKCGSLIDARRLFDQMTQRTIFTWNAMIGSYVSNGEPNEALKLFQDMQVQGVAVDACTFPTVLKASAALKDPNFGTGIHGLAVKSGFGSFVFVVNSLVAMYAKCGDVRQSRQLFDRMVDRGDVVTWNSIISAYSLQGQPLEALKLFREMQMAGVSMNSYTVVGALQACGEPSFAKLGMEIHNALLKSGQNLHVYEANALLVMYARCGKMDEAVRVFQQMDDRDDISWNSMLSGFVQNGLYDKAIEFFHEMQDADQKPCQVSMINIVSASGRLGTLLNGMECHAYAIKHGLDSDLQVGNTLVDMYAKCCCVIYMGRAFDKMPDKDYISWTTAIAGYAQNCCYLEALRLFREAQVERMQVDALMIGSILLPCGGLRCISYVKQIHNYVMRQGLFDLVLENTIIDVYGECGEIEYASRIFKRIENKDVVSWTSMISCYIHNGLSNEALDLFYDMVDAGIAPDSISFVSILSAAASLSALSKGKEIHGFMLRNGFTLEGSIASSLVDMYAKCGTIDYSYNIFNRITHKDLVLWTSMINASGMHGHGREAIGLFTKLKETDLIPDHITFLALLYACSHSGLIDEGKRYLEIMRREYQLEPWPEHYACVVDLLGRANCLDEAYRFVKSMPIEPTAAVWCSLLGACRVHSDNELGEIAAQKLLELEPENPGNYVLVSNVFAATQKWKDVDGVRTRMKVMGLRKNPACSWIEVGNKVHAFTARDRSHPQIEEIYMNLAEITKRLEREGGYLPETKYVLHDVGEEEKVNMLYGHSERLAIAFGLISTREGTPIRITKNLRVCGDCHVFTKLISRFFKREIVVRDANRFHHFQGGVCSCGDFW
ncbi:pentatricopeptide repeat-containing protein At3g63370, chloroplastic [Telopea speciosissima]|uniref:pentatricopeptide repeat-containing protein At3g63370, chloroplastic n=1 Tax=Telopea speciosissima TaxID=54955 RepID=UPI001CC59D9F|nr:pentatricopeptide repeat-containing protein At3g63370, chloroplastic [Telopea speciosissima]